MSGTWLKDWQDHRRRDREVKPIVVLGPTTNLLVDGVQLRVGRELHLGLGEQVPVPRLHRGAPGRTAAVSAVGADEMILDIGPPSMEIRFRRRNSNDFMLTISLR